MTTYIWRVRTRLPGRYMTPCRVLARGKLNTCLVEFEDGYQVTTSRNYLVKQETLQKKNRKRALGASRKYIGDTKKHKITSE